VFLSFSMRNAAFYEGKAIVKKIDPIDPHVRKKSRKDVSKPWSFLARAKAFYRGAMVSCFERWLAIAAVVAAAVLSVVFSNWAYRL
jgi:hypothetical protein